MNYKDLIFWIKSCDYKIFLTNLTCLVISRAFLLVYSLYLGFQSLKLIWILLKIRKNISKAISILLLDNNKFFLKTQDFLSLLSIGKETIIILKVFSLLLLIF